MPRSRHVGRLGLITTLGLVAAPLTALPAVADVSPDAQVIINEVYGAGGNSGSVESHDFVELYNKGTTPVDVSTWSIQYASAVGTNWSGRINLTGSIAPGSHYLVQAASQTGAATPSTLPPFDATGSVNFSATSGNIALATTQTALTCATTACAADDAVTDLVGFGSGAAYAGAGPAPAPSTTTSISRTAFASTANNAADFTTGVPTPQASGGGGEPPPPPPPPVGACGDDATLVSTVQGSTATSPITGDTVVVEAVVTAIKNGLSGYYVQEEAADSDSDATTSEGVFVRTGSADNNAVTVGDLVRVRGTVTEFASRGTSQTQLSAPDVVVCSETVPAVVPTAVTFPLAATDDLEDVEGMLVVLSDELVISEYFNYDRFGEVVLGKPFDGQDRLYTPTAVVEPGPAAQTLAAEQDRRIITLDDYNSSQNPTSIPHPGNGEPFSATNTFRGGDTVTGVEGVIDHTFGLYRIQPTEYGAYDAVNPRPTDAPEVGGDVKVASFNVLNYFNGDGDGGGFPTSRGADTQEEFDRQSEKIEAALVEIDADVVGLIEIENDATAEGGAVDELVDRLNAELAAQDSPRTYAYVDTGPVGSDEIKNAFIYDTATIDLVGFDVLDDVDPFTRNTRPPIAARFVEKATGEEFVPIVNHFKSKGSGTGENADAGDGQGASNPDRVKAAQALVSWTETDEFFAADDRLLVIGDLNAYDKEDPIDVLVEAGYADLIKQFGGELAYGYVFDGLVGYLDHALANDTLTPLVTGAAEWHVNADEPDILDYNLDFGRSPAYYTDGPHRGSDHDAVLVGLELAAQEPAPTTCFGAEPTIVGGPGGGVIQGTNGDDVILALDGSYDVRAGNGDDLVCTGDGADVVRGGNGDDRISTGDGDDELRGENGDDELLGGAGDDRLLGGNGDDVLDGGEGDDEIDGGRGTTTVVESGAAD